MIITLGSIPQQGEVELTGEYCFGQLGPKAVCVPVYHSCQALRVLYSGADWEWLCIAPIDYLRRNLSL